MVQNISWKRFRLLNVFRLEDQTMFRYRALLSVLATWDVVLHKVGNRLVIRVRAIYKAYIPANTSQQHIMYEPPPEHFETFQQFMHYLWKLFSELSSRSWPILVSYSNCLSYQDLFQNSIEDYDHLLLFDKSKFTTIVLCTDEILIPMTKYIA